MAPSSAVQVQKRTIYQYNQMEPDAKLAIRVSIAFLILAIYSVGFRLLARARRNIALDAGDVCLLLGLVLFAASTAVFIRGVQSTGGTVSMAQMTPQELHIFFKFFYAAEILFVCTKTVTKVSILLLYTCMFSTKRFRQAAWVTMGICVAWLIAFGFVIIFQCTPVEDFWLRKVRPSRCMTLSDYTVPLEATNIAIDVLILSLPIFMIKRLHLDKPRKIGLTFIFALGGIVVIVSAIRLYYFANHGTLFHIDVWSFAQLGVAILCASVPVYGQYLINLAKVFGRLSNRFSQYWTKKFGSHEKEMLKRPSNEARQDELPHKTNSESSIHASDHISEAGVFPTKGV